MHVLEQELKKVQLFQEHLFCSYLASSKISDLRAQADTARDHLQEARLLWSAYLTSCSCYWLSAALKLGLRVCSVVRDTMASFHELSMDSHEFACRFRRWEQLLDLQRVVIVCIRTV